jgi:hypothetical protein
MLKSDMPRSNATRGATLLGRPAVLGCPTFLGLMAGALSVLSTIAPMTARAGSPSMDPTATPPVYERPIVAANMQCQGTIKVAGETAQTGPYAEMQARHNAIESWRNQVSNRYGADFTQWWRAPDKDVACQASAGGVHCQALAAPCMAQGGSATMSGLGMGSANMTGQVAGHSGGQMGGQVAGQPAGAGLSERKR